MSTEKTNELVIVIEQSGLEKEKKDNAIQAYQPFMQELDEISYIANECINFENPSEADSKTARELRLKLVKVRTGAEGKKKERKENILLLGKLEDHATGVVVTASKLMEERLDKVEKHAERLAEEERQRVKESRLALLAPFNVDITYIPIATLPEEDFKKLLSDSELLFNAKIEADRKKEEERLKAEQAEAKAKEEQRIENERLKQEAQKRELEIEKQRKAEKKEQEKNAKLQKERLDLIFPYLKFSIDIDHATLWTLSEQKFARCLEKAREAFEKDEKERSDLEKEQAKQRAEDQRQRQEEKRKAAETEAENKRLKEEQSKREEEERQRLEQEKEAQRKAALAPDRDKLLKMNEQLDALIFPHDVESDKAKIAINDTIAMVEKLKAFIIKRSEEL